MDLKTAAISNTFHKDYITRISYFSDDYFLDCDILIIDLREVMVEIENMYVGQDEIQPGYLMEGAEKSIRLKVEERRVQLTQYFNGGGNLFVQMAQPTVVTFHQDDDKNPVLKVDLLYLIGLESSDFVLDPKRGNNLLFGDEVLRSFFKEFSCSYEFIYRKYKGAIAAKIRSTGAPVSVIISKGRGNILLLPDVRVDADDYDEYEYRNSVILQAFQKLDQELKTRYKPVPDIKVPDWCSAVFLSNESAQLKKLDKLFEDRDRIQQKIEEQQVYLTRYTDLKELLFESSTSLENRVQAVLTELGYQILETEERRDDLIIQHKEDVAVIEIKGLKGSAAESNASQLMKWVTTYHHDNGKSPKGILIVNPYKDRPLRERTDHAFPSQMLPYCEKMELTLLTTTQLLGLYLDFKNGEISFKKIHSLLWNSVGRVEYKPTKISD